MTSTINENCYYSKGLSMTDHTCSQGRIICIGCSSFVPKKGMKGAIKRFNHRVKEWFKEEEDNQRDNMDRPYDDFDGGW